MIVCSHISKNSPEVDRFKENLIKEFTHQRRAIELLLARIRVNQENAEYLQKRAEGKIERRIQTDAIKEFCEYATVQGSENAHKWYYKILNIDCLYNQDSSNLDTSGG